MAHQRRSRGLRKRGDGSRGPRHSSASATCSSVATALGISALGISGSLAAGAVASMLAPCVCWLLMMLLISTACRIGAACRGTWPMRPLRTTAFVFLCLFVVFLLSGFNLEGNMEPEMEAGNETLPADDEWLLQVETEKRSLEELPYVKEVSFVYGDTANLCKVGVSVWCCLDKSGGRFAHAHAHTPMPMPMPTPMLTPHTCPRPRSPQVQAALRGVRLGREADVRGGAALSPLQSHRQARRD